MDLALFPAMDFARDIFMFSFYTRGMSFIDMAYLKKKDLQNGILSYRRQKTGQQLFVKWEKPMQEIVDKYDTNATPYLLPVIRDMHADARRQYKNAAHLVNDKLKKLGEQLGLDIPLTSYVARHGWLPSPRTGTFRSRSSARRWDMIRRKPRESISPLWTHRLWTRLTAEF